MQVFAPGVRAAEQLVEIQMRRGGISARRDLQCFDPQLCGRVQHGFQAIAAGGDGWGVVADGIKERARITGNEFLNRAKKSQASPSCFSPLSSQIVSVFSTSLPVTRLPSVPMISTRHSMP